MEFALLFAFVIPLFLALAVMAYTSTLYITDRYNEGWNAYLDAAAAQGEPIYFSPSALFTNNYPPLSFYIVGGAAKIFGDAIFVGRAIAWISFLAIALSIFGILRELGHDLAAAIFGGMLFAAYMVEQYAGYVGYDDPQMLAHAVASGGLYLFVRWERKWWATVAAAAVISFALFIKHMIVALPMTVAIWLLFNDWKACLRFSITGILFAVGGLALCCLAFGHFFVTSVLAPRQFSWHGYQSFIVLLVPMEVPLAICVLGIATTADRFSRLFTLYTLISLLTALGFSGGEGVDMNRMFEAVIGFSLAGGHFVGMLRRWLDQSSLRALRAAVIFVSGASILTGVAVGATRDVLLIRPWIQESYIEQRSTLDAARQIAAEPGPSLCQRLAVCYWAHKPMAVDLFNFRQGVLAGTKSLGALEAQIGSGYFSSAEFYPDRPFPPPSVIREVRAKFASGQFTLVHFGRSGGDVYLRRARKRDP